MKLLPLPCGRNVILDDADYARVVGRPWYAVMGLTGIVYAARKQGCLHVYLHRQLVSARPGVLVDHRNRNGLDNRRRNLRMANGTQNQANRGKRKDSRQPYKGVRARSSGHWQARIKFQYQEIHLGFYDTAEQAATAHYFAAHLYFGEFAHD